MSRLTLDSHSHYHHHHHHPSWGFVGLPLALTSVLDPWWCVSDTFSLARDEMQQRETPTELHSLPFPTTHRVLIEFIVHRSFNSIGISCLSIHLCGRTPYSIQDLVHCARSLLALHSNIQVFWIWERSLPMRQLPLYSLFKLRSAYRRRTPHRNQQRPDRRKRPTSWDKRCPESWPEDQWPHTRYLMMTNHCKECITHAGWQLD